MNEELKKYIEENLIEEKKHFGFLSKMMSCDEDVDFEPLVEEHAKCSSVYVPDDEDLPVYFRQYNLEKYLDENSKYNDFQTLLFKLIDERNISDADVYNKVHIDRRLFSKIRSDKNYHPSKETVILLGLSLELNEKEIEELLDSASYSLPKNNHYDLIIRFCFMKGIYKLVDVNNLLDQYDCKLFNY